LAIRIAAKVAQAYPNFLCSANGLENIPNTIVSTKQLNDSNGIDDSSQTVQKLLDRSFCFITDADVSHAIKICFGAMAVVFHRDENLRPWVSQNVVENLWFKLFDSYDDLKSCRSKLKRYRIDSMTDITHLLCIMGLIDKRSVKEGRSMIKSCEIQIHHDLLFEYGKIVVIEFTQERIGANRNDGHSVEFKNHFADADAIGFQDILIRWNNLMVECYSCHFESVDSESDSDSDPTDVHMLYWLPHHMIKAKKLSAVLDLLSKRNFLRDRINTLGVLEGTKLYVYDIRELQKMGKIGHEWDDQCSTNENVVNKTKLTSLILMIGNFLPNYGYALCSMESKVEMGHALVLLGVTKQAFALWHESLECFNNALKFFQSIDLDENHPYIISTKRHIDVFDVMGVVSS